MLNRQSKQLAPCFAALILLGAPMSEANAARFPFYEVERPWVYRID